jgi:hypothetical protein
LLDGDFIIMTLKISVDGMVIEKEFRLELSGNTLKIIGENVALIEPKSPNIKI